MTEILAAIVISAVVLDCVLILWWLCGGTFLERRGKPIVLPLLALMLDDRP